MLNLKNIFKRNVQGVSLPRSGTSLLVKLLSKYFGRSLEIKTLFKKKGLIVARAFVWCEYYNHCQTTPCKYPRTVFQKNHDFDLSLTNRSDKYHLIQYREIVPSIISHYLWCVAHVTGFKNSPQSWKKFLEEQLIYCRRFIKKWVVDNQNPNAYILKYETFIPAVETKLAEVIGYFKPDEEIEQSWLRRVVQSEEIVTNDLEKFKYYDHDLKVLDSNLQLNLKN